ncbi:hypothetical protein Skr01_04770 [Sphaerisporangium krabiense]|uniref:PE domain-containing protein n=1 Tax=Sphaerisporangium krabiense TaxID=763782 RepID=A0A7W8Z7F5_9ACTN|nr:hypothetical protein [Sphaerisporangium krabiense]MBB5628766.1 hypothetical protein [Sphaerisporangium krabiense]GII60392.1 hypothetical protein Skr01_04770 [Sphaerisporangium krabiense]
MGDHGESGFAYNGFRLDDKWPGLEAPKDGVDVHHPTVKNLIKALEKDIERLKGYAAGTSAHLKGHGQVTAGHLGEWDAAQQLAVVFGKGHTAITVSYDKLIAQYEAAVVAAKAAFANIGKAETASTTDT